MPASLVDHGCYLDDYIAIDVNSLLYFLHRVITILIFYTWVSPSLAKLTDPYVLLSFVVDVVPTFVADEAVVQVFAVKSPPSSFSSMACESPTSIVASDRSTNIFLFLCFVSVPFLALIRDVICLTRCRMCGMQATMTPTEISTFDQMAADCAWSTG